MNIRIHMIFTLQCITPYKRPMLFIYVTHTHFHQTKTEVNRPFKDVFPLIPYWSLEFSGGCSFPCCDRDLKQLPRSHTLFRRSTLFDIQATDVVLWWVFSCLETQHIHFTQTKVQSISMNTWDSDHAFTQRYVHMPAHITHVKHLRQWKKMTLCTYFVHLCTLPSKPSLDLRFTA